MRLLLRSSALLGASDREAQPSVMRSFGEIQSQPKALDSPPFPPSGEDSE